VIAAALLQFQAGAGFQTWVGTGFMLNYGFQYVSNTVCLFRAGFGIFAVGEKKKRGGRGGNDRSISFYLILRDTSYRAISFAYDGIIRSKTILR